MHRIVLYVACVMVLGSTGKIYNSRRIVGGMSAEDGEFPFMVSLQKNEKHICGGSIVNNNTVLTAAHCIEKNISLVVGVSDLRKGGNTYNIKETVIHPGYNEFYYDIALIKIEGVFKFGPTVAPIVLYDKHVGRDVPCIACGWGRLNKTTKSVPNLKFVKLKTVSSEVCSVVYEAIDIQIGVQHICTLTKIDNGVCLGDSGGPLIDLDGRQIGIVSFIRPCAKGYPDVFSRISHFMPWINTINRFAETN